MKSRLQLISLTCALVTGLHASPADALSEHRLLAQIYSLGGVATLDPDFSFVEDNYQNGAPGVNSNNRALHASANSASGVLEVSGVTNNLTVANLSRATGLLEELMILHSVPIVVEAQLALDGGATGGFVQLDARLEVGNCIVGLSRNLGSASDGSQVVTNGCNDNAFVTWQASGGEGALQITATWAKKPPFGELYIGAQVSGDFGGNSGDIPTGSFTHSGQLSIATTGGGASYVSDSFLTEVPEPDAAAGLGVAIGAIAWLARGRARRS